MYKKLQYKATNWKEKKEKKKGTLATNSIVITKSIQ